MLYSLGIQTGGVKQENESKNTNEDAVESHWRRRGGHRGMGGA